MDLFNLQIENTLLPVCSGDCVAILGVRHACYRCGEVCAKLNYLKWNERTHARTHDNMRFFYGSIVLTRDGASYTPQNGVFKLLLWDIYIILFHFTNNILAYFQIDRNYHYERWGLASCPLKVLDSRIPSQFNSLLITDEGVTMHSYPLPVCNVCNMVRCFSNVSNCLT